MPELTDALCRTPEARPWFDTITSGHAGRAIAWCNRCRVRPECLAWALNHETSGVWGGHTPGGLKKLRTEFGIRLNDLVLHHAKPETETP